MRLFHSDRYYADLGEHVMPIRKFGLVRAGIEATGLPATFEEPPRATDEDLLRVHTPEYVRAVDTGEPRALAESQKFPWSPQLAEAVRWTNGGTIAALRAALDDGVAGNLASGFHHSYRTRGEGYCTFNGLVIAWERLRAEGRLRRALVVDMDLHYGNGTAFLCAERPELFNLSIYGNWYQDNVAYRDVTTRRTPDTGNAWSVAVPNGAGRDVYLGLLAEHLGPAIERARPDAILFQAGADPYKEDPYSPLDLDHDALHDRDRHVFETCSRLGIPVMWVLAGGYTKDVTKVVQVHVNTFRAASAVFGVSQRSAARPR
jgi:acetoin utilization deacetylase AcuC-like enzyme